MDQELVFQASYLEKQLQQLQEQLSFLDGEISELESLDINLKTIESAREKESFSSLGKGVYLKTNITEEDFLVEVGSGVLVKKTREETSKVIRDQIKKIADARESLSERQQIYQQSLQEIIKEIRKDPSALEHNHSHEHNHHSHSHSF